MRLVTTIILLLKFCRWYVADGLEKPAVVEPVDPFERCKLHRLRLIEQEVIWSAGLHSAYMASRRTKETPLNQS